MRIMNTYSIASFTHEYQLFWLMVIAFRNYAAQFGPGRWVPTPHSAAQHS